MGSLNLNMSGKSRLFLNPEQYTEFMQMLTQNQKIAKLTGLILEDINRSRFEKKMQNLSLSEELKNCAKNLDPNPVSQVKYASN